MEKLGNWIYMSQKEVTVRDIMKAVEAACETEIWEELGVLEIELPSGDTMDMEETAIHPKDEETKKFADAHNVVCVFYVTFPEENVNDAEKIMKLIVGANGGFFCGDTEGFIPVIK